MPLHWGHQGMEHQSEPRKHERTTDTTELHEILQRLNNTYGNGQPVTPLPSQARLATPENGHTPHMTSSEHGGVDPQPDRVLPPRETHTVLQREDHTTTPHTTPSETMVSPQPDPAMPHGGTQQDLKA